MRERDWSCYTRPKKNKLEKNSVEVIRIIFDWWVGNDQSQPPRPSGLSEEINRLFSFIHWKERRTDYSRQERADWAVQSSSEPSR